MQCIFHMKSYCQDIASAIRRFGSSYETFSNDKDFFNSVSMSIMQIGELSGGLSAEFKEQTTQRIQWGPIRAMRNLFAHGYASMDAEVVWETATRDIPALLEFCEGILKSNQTASDVEE